MEIKAVCISRGKGSGEALISREPIGFLGGVDPESGVVIEIGHELEGKCVAGKVLVFPNGKGSTVGSYVMLQLAKNGKAPAAIINERAEPIITVGAIISGIPVQSLLIVWIGFQGRIVKLFQSQTGQIQFFYCLNILWRWRWLYWFWFASLFFLLRRIIY